MVEFTSFVALGRCRDCFDACCFCVIIRHEYEVKAQCIFFARARSICSARRCWSRTCDGIARWSAGGGRRGAFLWTGWDSSCTMGFQQSHDASYEALTRIEAPNGRAAANQGKNEVPATTAVSPATTAAAVVATRTPPEIAPSKIVISQKTICVVAHARGDCSI
jgi:hypothetical protein